MKMLAYSPTLIFTPEPATLKYWTVHEYRQMSELGILNADDRTELIEGQILIMAAKGTPHVLGLRLLAVALDTLLANELFFISTQDPIVLNDFSEPEPDVAIVRGTALDYADRHPDPNDLALVVEVADSTLKYDCEVKDKLYAQSGIEDYWVLDVKNRQLHIFRNPTPTGYTSHLILTPPNSIAPLVFPDRSVSLIDILPPASGF
jgi:Uma2 family endonuclease